MFEFTVDPKTIDIIKIISDYRHPCFFKRSVFDKAATLRVQFSEYVAVIYAFFKPAALRFNAGMRLFASDNAAKVLAFDIFFGEIYKITLQ